MLPIHKLGYLQFIDCTSIVPLPLLTVRQEDRYRGLSAGHDGPICTQTIALTHKTQDFTQEKLIWPWSPQKQHIA